MKRKITAIVLCSLLLGLMALLSAATAGDGGTTVVPQLVTVAPQFAGTYVNQSDAFGGVCGFQTLSSDGTHSGTNTNCCGIAGNLQGPIHGIWEKTGPKEITLTTHCFVFDLSGTLLATARITEVITFDEAYETAVGQCGTELWFGYIPDFEQDPPDLGPIPWADIWTRLHSNIE